MMFYKSFLESTVTFSKSAMKMNSKPQSVHLICGSFNVKRNDKTYTKTTRESKKTISSKNE